MKTDKLECCVSGSRLLHQGEGSILHLHVELKETQLARLEGFSKESFLGLPGEQPDRLT